MRKRRKQAAKIAITMSQQTLPIAHSASRKTRAWPRWADMRPINPSIQQAKTAFHGTPALFVFLKLRRKYSPGTLPSTANPCSVLLATYNALAPQLQAENIINTFAICATPLQVEEFFLTAASTNAIMMGEAADDGGWPEEKPRRLGW